MNIVMDVRARFGAPGFILGTGPGNGNSQNGTDRCTGTEAQRSWGTEEQRIMRMNWQRHRVTQVHGYGIMAISGENLSADCAMLALMGWCADLCETPALVHPSTLTLRLRLRLRLPVPRQAARPASRRVVMHRQARILRVIHRSKLWMGGGPPPCHAPLTPLDQER